MVCEGILNICGTSSKEIEKRAIKAMEEADAAFYLPKIDQLTAEIAQLKARLSKYEEILIFCRFIRLGLPV